MPKEPKVLGRMAEDDERERPDPRAGTSLVGAARVPYVSGAVGEVSVELYQSEDQEDRGGVVLRIRTKDDASSFVAHAERIEGGVELHMAGDAEGEALVRALQAALQTYRR